MVREMSKTREVRRFYFWHPDDQEWYVVLAVGGYSATQWASDMRKAGYCICTVKRTA
jgi:hypothetical protein